MTSELDVPRKSIWIKTVGLLLVLLLITVVYGGWMTFENWRAHQEAESQADHLTLEWFGLGPPTANQLDARFSDADGDLVADTPDGSQQISPAILYFSYIAAPDAAQQQDIWREFADYLSKQTGIPVEVTSFATTHDQLEALRNGKLHVTGLNTGAVPMAVNDCGFVPVCTLGRNDGSFGSTMQLIVPVSSPIQDIKDLKGRTIIFPDREFRTSLARGRDDWQSDLVHRCYFGATRELPISLSTRRMRAKLSL